MYFVVIESIYQNSLYGKIEYTCNKKVVIMNLELEFLKLEVDCNFPCEAYLLFELE